jgi:hypothetical protein
VVIMPLLERDHQVRDRADRLVVESDTQDRNQLFPILEMPPGQGISRSSTNAEDQYKPYQQTSVGSEPCGLALASLHRCCPHKQ